MNANRYTPGPWRLVRDFPYWNIKSGDTLIAETMLGGNTAPNQQETDDANARLIAAAPDLLAACKDLNEYLNAVANQLPVGELPAVLEKVKSSAEVIDAATKAH